MDSKKIELLDTIHIMISPDYKERFAAEYWQTFVRHDRLNSMIQRHEAKTLDFTPSCPIELLKRQRAIMEDYMLILKERAEIEGIKLVGITL